MPLSWNDCNDAWNSALKLHYAGCLFYYDGKLYGRGGGGVIWAGTQVPLIMGNVLLLGSDQCDPYEYWKSYGLSARCIKEQGKK